MSGGHCAAFNKEVHGEICDGFNEMHSWMLNPIPAKSSLPILHRNQSMVDHVVSTTIV